MAVTLPQREFTDAEIDGMSQAELKAALKNVNLTVGGRVAALKARLKAFMDQNRAPIHGGNLPPAAVPVTTAPAAAATSSTAATAAAAAMSYKNTQDWQDLMRVMKPCAMTDWQSDRLADNLNVKTLGDLNTLDKDEIELAIEYYNNGLKGTSDAIHSIRNPMIPKRLQALLHKIKIWALAGITMEPSEWASPLQVAQGVEEMKAFETHEKNKTDPTEFPDEMKASKMREESDKLFVQMKATLEAITSADGLSNLAYLMWEPDWKLSANPTVSERISHKKDRTGTVFHLDNSKFYKMLQKWGLSESWYSTIKKFAATQDGRGAYIALRRLYQGDDHIKAKLMEANRRISSNGLSYPGEPEGSFQVYSSNLKEEYEML